MLLSIGVNLNGFDSIFTFLLVRSASSNPEKGLPPGFDLPGKPKLPELNAIPDHQ
jgi:hypothetical protein